MSTERSVRLALGALGLGLVAVGAYAFVLAVPAGQWARVVAWLAGGVVLHDAVVAPVAVVAGLLLLRGRRPWLQRLGRVAGLLVVTLLVVTVPLLATGGLR